MSAGVYVCTVAYRCVYEEIPLFEGAHRLAPVEC